MVKRKRIKKSGAFSIATLTRNIKKKLKGRYSAQKIKKVFLLELPYIFIFLTADRTSCLYRISPGNNAGDKIMYLLSHTEKILGLIPSFELKDMMIGAVTAIVVKVIFWQKKQDRKKLRKGVEYGSARWGNAEDIRPYQSDDPWMNIPLTATESLTMESRPADPKYARNKNILVIGGSGSGKTRFFVKPSVMQMNCSYVLTDPKGSLIEEVGSMLAKGPVKRDEHGRIVKDKNGKPVHEPYVIKVLNAVRAYKATELWLKDRLGLEISPDKSKVVNLKRQYSDFLGFKLKVRKKGKKYVVRSHMSDKAYKKAHEKVSEEVKKLAHSSDDNAQFMQLQKYNSVVAGLHEYYCISTEVSHDFSRLAFSINKQLRNRLKGDLSKKGQLRNGFIKEKYGASRQMRFLHGRPVVPLGYVQSKNAQHKRKSINKYTVKGREQIHKNLAIDTATMLWLMRNPVKGRTIEYADNRISLYAAQYGKCAVTGIPMDSHDIHCHHKVPVSNGGSDEYANLILVSKAVHILIHASSEPTIEKYLKSLNLDNKQIEKLNKLRTMAEMPPIIL